MYRKFLVIEGTQRALENLREEGLYGGEREHVWVMFKPAPLPTTRSFDPSYGECSERLARYICCDMMCGTRI